MLVSKVSLGICAMAKKVNSKHMQHILLGLSKFDEFNLVIFDEKMIFKEEVTKWPVVDAMIVFFSGGFPYSKVLQYIKLNNPFLINDFEMQKIFWDRRKVYSMLKENGIPTPKNVLIDRGEIINNDGTEANDLNNEEEIEKMIKEYRALYAEKPPQKKKSMSKKHSDNDTNIQDKEHDKLAYNIIEQTVKNNNYDSNDSNNSIDANLHESDDYIEYKGVKLIKPFVEKPCNGDDHNIYIYYPMSHGGGHKRLFRKTLDLCSLYYPNENYIRRDKSYIYEEFLQTDGFDIKVYTVGPEYAHAEARKSPSLDGKVQRTHDGKEVRYPVNLTPEEKEIARKIVLIFKQNVCGFDILRARGQSYVCDVNGWSFVKGNKKYYEDCVILLRKIILQKINKELFLQRPINLVSSKEIYEGMIIPKIDDNKTYNEELRSIVGVFRHADRSPKQKMKLVVEDPLILSLFDKFRDKEKEYNPKTEIKLKKPNELTEVLKIVKTILHRKGINESQLNEDTDNFYIKLFQIKLVLEKNLNFEGMTRKIQMKPLSVIDTKVVKALMIIKWGGNITHAGIQQAKLLGQTFRAQLYPSGPENGDDLLRLHATYRHDLKCYSSEEGRCLKTAAAFLQGLLQLEGHLIPIISSMVRRDETIGGILDVSCTEIESLRKTVKSNLNDFCNYDGVLSDKYSSIVNKDIDNTNKNTKANTQVGTLMKDIGNFYSRMKRVYELMAHLLNHLKTKLSITELKNECGTYFIKNPTSILSRKSSGYEKIAATVKHLGQVPETKRRISDVKIPSHSSSSSFLTEHTNLKSHQTTSEMDCEDEKIVLIFKRYVKLHQDFYNKSKNHFEISKIPDIYDNIKYDILHNKSIMNKSSYELYNEISLLANFVMPLEYGITRSEKVNIGVKIVKPLIRKINKDLMWWSDNTNTIANNDEHSYSGLDQAKLNQNDIKSTWRHVKTRFYFASASHLYSLFNAIVYAYNSFLVDENENEIFKICDLDYCSHIVFRLFENFNVDKDNDKRWRMEVIMSPGSNKDPKMADDKHMVPVAPWIIVNRNLNMKQMREFFDYIDKRNEFE